MEVVKYKIADEKENEKHVDGESSDSCDDSLSDLSENEIQPPALYEIEKGNAAPLPLRKLNIPVSDDSDGSLSICSNSYKADSARSGIDLKEHVTLKYFAKYVNGHDDEDTQGPKPGDNQP